MIQHKLILLFESMEIYGMGTVSTLQWDCRGQRFDPGSLCQSGEGFTEKRLSRLLRAVSVWGRPCQLLPRGRKRARASRRRQRVKQLVARAGGAFFLRERARCYGFEAGLAVSVGAGSSSMIIAAGASPG
jgi:hypothetical protein